MNRITIIVFATFAFVFLSCTQLKTNPDAVVKTKTPDALKDGSELTKTYRSGQNLTEELYKELVDNSADLKKMEEDLSTINTNTDEVNTVFTKYNGKSNSYYGSAGNIANEISDSTMRKDILRIIGNSRLRYDEKSAGIKTLLERIARNNSNLRDQHAALKVVLTFPLIEKFQDENLPKSKEFNELIREQGKLMERMDSLRGK